MDNRVHEQWLQEYMDWKASGMRCSSMLNDISPGQFRKIYIACGNTDLRYGVDGLARVIQEEFELDPFVGDLYDPAPSRCGIFWLDTVRLPFTT